MAEQLSHALLYRYVESKEALLELAVRYAIDQEADLEQSVPLATPADGQVVELIRARLTAQATFPRVRGALEREPAGCAAVELAAIIDELYDFIERNRLPLLLVESLADDFVEITGSSVNSRKGALNGRLATFLASRVASGERDRGDPKIAAHFLSESIAWFAQHPSRNSLTCCCARSTTGSMAP